jgi:uncharacterized membrane protein YhaH (DUF805 family)
MFSLNLMFQPLTKYFDFQGRARRSEYWLFYLFQVIVSIVFVVFEALSTGTALGGIVSVMSTAFGLGMLIPNISVGVRRFHDIGRTGWWTIFYPIVFIVSLIMFSVLNSASLASMGNALSGIDPQALETGDPEAMLVLFSALGPMLLWVLVPTLLASVLTFVFHITDSQKGTNRFGPNPKTGTKDDMAATFN